jgi:hypothetical protein
MVCVEITHREELSRNLVIEIPWFAQCIAPVCLDAVAMSGLQTEPPLCLENTMQIPAAITVKL